MNEPRRIGPYRLGERLGEGGMGVVWDAWHERLERRVALKHLHPERDEDPRHRQRFLREAQAVARLDHPSVVRIHELLETDDGDWIVMEHVPGTSLAEHLREAPLPIGDLLDLGEQIAEGLAAAHDADLLHRDLKAENVLLTPDGRAKILDFGLAKPLGGKLEDSEITGTGDVVGTWRAMSPEQALGVELNPRSDLFSLGVLLYEAATGVSPFQRASHIETLKSVCYHLQEPAASLRPELPDALSRLLDTLLEKEAARRPRDAQSVAEQLAALRQSPQGSNSRAHTLGQLSTVVAPRPTEVDSSRPLVEPTKPGRNLRWRNPAVLALGGVLLAFAISPLGPWNLWPEPAARRVATAPVELGVGGERGDVALAAEAVRSAELRALLELEGLAPVAAGRAPGRNAPASLAAAAVVDEVLTAQLDCSDRSCRISMQRLAGADERLLWAESFEAPLEDLPLLATAVAAAITRAYPEHSARAETLVVDVSAADYARYLEIERAVQERPEGGDLGQLLHDLGTIRGRAPAFLEVYLLEARLWNLQYWDSRRAEDLERALARVREARALAPQDPRVAAVGFSVAFGAKRLDAAAREIDRLESLQPGDPDVQAKRALLAEHRGQGGEALRLLREAANRRPSWWLLLDLANMELRQGQLDAARSTLAEVRRRFPEEMDGLALWAQIELLSGDPARSAELYEELVARAPRFAELTNLGTAQLLLGRPQTAAISFRRALKLAPENPSALLNLADAELLQGHDSVARETYEQVITVIDDDPATPGSWQWQTIRAQALAHLGRAADAAAGVQLAHQLAPENPQVAFESALVYALVGDDASALASAKRALDLGVQARWFFFPWFDDLRQHPELAARLGA